MRWWSRSPRCSATSAACWPDDPAALAEADNAPPATVLSLAAIGRSAVLVDVKRRLQQLAQSAAPLLLRGEPGMRADLFARFTCGPGAPFVTGDTLGSEPPADLLARASGGVLFLADLGKFGGTQLQTVYARSDKPGVPATR